MTGPEYRERDAFAAWLPEYAHVVFSYRNPSTGRPVYGFEGIEIDPERFPHIWARRNEIRDRFFERYASRRINQETLLRWQLRLQNRFDEIAARFERAYKLYDEHKTEIDNDVLEGFSTVQWGRSADSGTDKTTGKTASRSIDTPDKAVNHDKNYADRITENDSEAAVEHGLVNDFHNSKTFRKSGVVLTNVNKTIDAYRDIDGELVRCFENNFLNVLWS